MTSPPERVIDTQIIYQGRVVGFQLNTIILPDGQTATREIFTTPGAVGIVALTDDNHVRLVRQYRSAIQDYMLEIPAGTLEPGEAPEVAAPRELAEETGDRAAHWEHLTSIRTTPGICSEILHVFLATGLTSGNNHPDPDEYLQIISLPFNQALDMVRSGKIQDAKSIVGLLLAAEKFT